ncbi:MAG: hypothetical protein HY554_08545 [Elusimicrobia bacterium]|nr:hypothetical protein [Elusimicrobiota bacterium]
MSPRLRRPTAALWSRAACVGSVVLLVAAALGVERLARPRRSQRLAASGPAPGWLPKPSAGPARAGLAPGQDLEHDRLPASPQERELSFGQLMDLLGAQALEAGLDPAAKDAARALTADPEVKAVYDRFRREELAGRRRSGIAFVRRVQATAAWRRLAARFRGQPGSAAAALSLQRDPRLRRFWNEWARAAGLPPSWDKRGAPPSRGVQGRSPAAPAAAAVHSAGSAAVAKAAEPSGGNGPPAAAPGPRAPGGFSSRPAGGRADGHDVGGKLEDLAPGGSKPSDEFCNKALFKWLCDHLTAGQLDEIEARIPARGLWGACWELGYYPQCLDACQNAKSGCSPKPAWDACMDARSQELTCIGECLDRQPCAVPKPIFDAHCLVRAPAPPPAQCRGRGRSAPPLASRPSAPGGPASASPPRDDGGCHDWSCLDEKTQAFFMATHGGGASDAWAQEHEKDRRAASQEQDPNQWRREEYEGWRPMTQEEWDRWTPPAEGPIE